MRVNLKWTLLSLAGAVGGLVSLCWVLGANPPGSAPYATRALAACRAQFGPDTDGVSDCIMTLDQQHMAEIQQRQLDAAAREAE